MHRSQIRVALSLLAASLLPISHVRPVEAKTNSTCGYRHVEVSKVQGTELATTCKALADVVTYFHNIDLDFDPIVSLKFRDKIVEVSRSAPPGRSYGYFDERNDTIVMMRSSVAHPWGLDWNSELAASFLRHELTHMAVRLILGNDYGRLRPEWHEFIAYSVQFELMNPSLRNSILASHREVMEFPSLAGINEFTSRMDPAIFSIASYKTYQHNGSEKLIRRLLRFEFQPPSMSYPFAVLPGQIPQVVRRK